MTRNPSRPRLGARRRAPRKGVRFALVPLLLFLSGASFQPVSEEAGTPMTPPETYRRWWAATEECAGKKADFDRVEWFVREGFDFVCPTGRCVGRWEPKFRIYVASRWRSHEMVVRHEMLHAILGTGSHPDAAFVQRCRLTWETWHPR